MLFLIWSCCRCSKTARRRRKIQDETPSSFPALLKREKCFVFTHLSCKENYFNLHINLFCSVLWITDVLCRSTFLVCHFVVFCLFLCDLCRHYWDVLFQFPMAGKYLDTTDLWLPIATGLSDAARWANMRVFHWLLLHCFWWSVQVCTVYFGQQVERGREPLSCFPVLLLTINFWGSLRSSVFAGN